MVLFKMLNRGMFCAINGCISTGKEANVYHAVNTAGVNFAIKVYKTSILVFKDRDRCGCAVVPCGNWVRPLTLGTSCLNALHSVKCKTLQPAAHSCVPPFHVK